MNSSKSPTKTFVYMALIFAAYWYTGCGAVKPTGKIDAVADGQSATDALAQEIASNTDVGKTLDPAGAKRTHSQ